MHTVKAIFRYFCILKKKLKEKFTKPNKYGLIKLQKNRKGIWNIVDSYRKGQSSSNNSDISADELNIFFKEVFQPPDSNLSDIHIPFDPNSSWCSLIEPEEIEKHLQRLKGGIGSDDIPAKLLNFAASLLSAPICHLFNTSILLHSVPNKWKISKIVPIPKKSNPSISDFRPISLLPIISKILERCILDRMYPSLLRNYGLNQYGFRKKSNTTCAAVSIYDDIMKQWENPEVKAAVIVSYDASKAFDTVPYDLLLYRLMDTDIAPGFIRWLKDYLTNRKQFVIFNNTSSDHVDVISGVPQGAVLSPSIFCVFIAPLSALSKPNSLYKFADDMDLTLFITEKPTDEIICANEINNILTWTLHNKIKLNNSKTAKLVFTKNYFQFSFDCLSDIREEDTLTILGVKFSSNFSWSAHIDMSIKKACKYFYLIRCLKCVLNRKQLIILHNALIQSQFDYGSQLYVGSISYADRLRIKRTISRTHRLICGNDCRNNCLPDPDERRLKLALVLYKNAIEDVTHSLHDRMPNFLPSGRRVNIPFARSAKRQLSFVPFMSIFYNNSID